MVKPFEEYYKKIFTEMNALTRWPLGPISKGVPGSLPEEGLASAEAPCGAA